ncbi:hypothetical protein TR80_001710 [Xanthomonas campestris]|uniref:hypothetical protein n=1 Tax=Xanthomonas campestris TaxID=339 RepID=UPI0011AF3A9D|nr:hypothetical protein [Xanthomonas campestris]TXD45158.1 hypothetical protein TR80_001710 [Xanthomonas campestris]
MLALIVGIISSLLATGLFIGASELIRRVFLPWYADKVYRGVRIDGDWDMALLEGVPKPDGVQMSFHLKQSGDKISGQYSHGTPETRRDIYNLTGILRDGYFLACATPASNRHLDGISVLLHVQSKKDDLLMVGSVLCCDAPGAVMAVGPVTFKLVGR